eukprot:2730794-Alexandrium_andersonii.AAC.1
MHGMSLGIDQHICGNIIWDHTVESSDRVKDYPTTLLGVWGEFRAWCPDGLRKYASDLRECLRKLPNPSGNPLGTMGA